MEEEGCKCCCGGCGAQGVLDLVPFRGLGVGLVGKVVGRRGIGCRIWRGGLEFPDLLCCGAFA